MQANTLLDDIRERHGDCVRRGLALHSSTLAGVPEWRPVPTPVDAFISRPQLLETVLGAKVRSVSRRVLDQTRQKCPHLDLRQQWQCFHTMFDATVTSGFTDVLNRNLVAAGQPSVTPGEFHCFVAMFLMHCVEVGGVEGVRERCVGKRGDSVKGLISSDRYSVLKRHFTLMPHGTPQTKRVRVGSQQRPLQRTPGLTPFTVFRLSQLPSTRSKTLSPTVAWNSSTATVPQSVSLTGTG